MSSGLFDDANAARHSAERMRPSDSQGREGSNLYRHAFNFRDLLEVVDGEVTEIFRERSSLFVASGETVLSDDQLKEHLRRLLAYIIASTMLPMNPCSCHPTGPDPTRATTRSSDGMTKQRFAL